MNLKLLQFGIFIIFELVYILLDSFDILLRLLLSSDSILDCLLQFNNCIPHPLHFGNNLLINTTNEWDLPSKQNYS